jgi:thioredoxin-related protein
MKGKDAMIACLLVFCLFLSPFSSETPSKSRKIASKKHDSVAVYEDKEAVIVMYSRDNCPPCLRWWEVERPRWEALGWRIEKITDNASNKLTPWFHIKDRDGKKFDVRGFMDGEKFRKAKEGVR